jgi:hypothetical protein
MWITPRFIQRLLSRAAFTSNGCLMTVWHWECKTHLRNARGGGGGQMLWKCLAQRSRQWLWLEALHCTNVFLLFSSLEAPRKCFMGFTGVCRGHALRSKGVHGSVCQTDYKGHWRILSFSFLHPQHGKRIQAPLTGMREEQLLVTLKPLLWFIYSINQLQRIKLKDSKNTATVKVTICWAQWLTPIIWVTWEAELGRIKVWDSLGKKFMWPYLNHWLGVLVHVGHLSCSGKHK